MSPDSSFQKGFGEHSLDKISLQALELFMKPLKRIFN